MRYLITLLALCGFAFSAQPYNLLVVIIDDWGVDFTSQNTDPAAIIPSTPEIDLLAAAGVKFTDFRTSAQCAQTRASFLTGRYPYLTAVTYVGAELPASEYTIADDLSENHSYETAMFGKWNLGGASDGAEQDYPRTRGGFGHFEGSYPVWQFRAAHYATPVTINGGASTTNAADRYITTDEADDAIAWIGTATEPWFVELCFHAPHFTGANSYLYPPAALQRNFTGTAGAEGGVNAYCSMIEALDTELGRVLDACDLSQTIVVVFGDNGSAFANTSVPADRIKGTNYDNGVRAPLIIRAPGTVNPGRRSNLFCNVVDLYPSLIKLATGSAHASPNTLSGQDISGVIRNEAVPSRRIQWDSDNSAASDPVITSDGQYRLYDFTTADDEFYHIASDPYEQTDLGTAGLTGQALRAYRNLRYAMTTFTNKTGEQAVIVADYDTTPTTSGNLTITSGGITVIRPTRRSPATIEAPLKTGATTYTLWKRANPFDSWVDTGLSPTVGSTVVFTDPAPSGRVEYRITNNAPEP